MPRVSAVATRVGQCRCARRTGAWPRARRGTVNGVRVAAACTPRGRAQTSCLGVDRPRQNRTSPVCKRARLWSSKERDTTVHLPYCTSSLPPGDSPPPRRASAAQAAGQRDSDDCCEPPPNGSLCQRDHTCMHFLSSTSGEPIYHPPRRSLTRPSPIHHPTTRAFWGLPTGGRAPSSATILGGHCPTSICAASEL